MSDLSTSERRHSPKFASLLKFYPLHITLMEHFYDFFGNADSVHVVSSSSGSGKSQSTKYTLGRLVFLKQFLINGAIKSAATVCKTVRPIFYLYVTLGYCG